MSAGAEDVAIEQGVVTFRLSKRPELDARANKQRAEEIAKEGEQFARDPFTVHAAVLDLRDAPATLGPDVLDPLAKLFAAFERAGKPLAIVCGPDAVQRLAMQRLQHDRAPSASRIFTTMIEAKAFLGSLKSDRPPRG